MIADEHANPDWVAMDPFSQAEHDEVAQSILLTPSDSLIAAVQASIAKLLPTMPRKDIIAASLANRGIIAKTRSLGEACDIANRIAPEHLSFLWPTPRCCCRCCAMREPYSWGMAVANPSATMLPAPITCCPLHAQRASRRRWVYDFQKRTS